MNKKTQEVLFSSKKSDWRTPKYVFDYLNSRMHFTLDAAADDINKLCSAYFTKEHDALKQNWKGHRVFVNPPYSRGLIYNFVKKGFEEGHKDNTSVTMLLPARTCNKWWHEFVMKANEIYFVKGRIKFAGSKQGAPFPSAIVVFNKELSPGSYPLIDSLSVGDMKRGIYDV